MSAGLTPEYARGVQLPSIFHPFERHEAVKAILSDPAMIGEGNHIEFHPGRQIDLIEQEQVWRGATSTSAPLLGRNALKGVASLLE